MYRIKSFVSLSLSLLLLLPASLLALPVEDLYVAEVFVTSRSGDQLKSGARAGLLQVLIRVSGNNEVQQNSLINRALRNPTSYYYQYSYQATDKKFQIGEQIIAGRILKLSFEPNAIARLLRDAGFPVWGSNRPSVLLWLAVSDETGRRLLSESDGSEIRTAMDTLTRQRGLPLLYPLLDIEDEALLSTAEVWGAFNGRIDRASVRYNPDGILSGRVNKLDSGQWTGNWSYRINGRWLTFNNSALSGNELVAGIIDILADSMAARYAIDSSRSIIKMRIEKINNLVDYAAVSDYLQSLNPVLETYVDEVQGSEVLFRLNTEGQAQQLIELIELDEKMLLIQSSDQNRHLIYQWLH